MLNNFSNFYLAKSRVHCRWLLVVALWLVSYSLAQTQQITTVAGSGVSGPGTVLSFPGGVFVDAAGNLYIADTGNNRIQKWVSIQFRTTNQPASAGTGNY